MTKKCLKCKKDCELVDFHKNKRYEDGLNKICKSCKKQYDADNYLERKDQKMNQVEIWQMLNPDKVRESRKRAADKKLLLGVINRVAKVKND